MFTNKIKCFKFITCYIVLNITLIILGVADLHKIIFYKLNKSIKTGEKIMFEETRKLIIVSDKAREKYANYLKQLISVKDDTEGEIVGIKDNSVDVAVWTEKEYLHNKPTISSSQNIIFIGNEKLAKNECTNINIKFDKFGMKYGWLGNIGKLFVENKMLSLKDHSAFAEYCKEKSESFKKTHYNVFNRIPSFVNVIGILAAPIITIPLFVVNQIGKNRAKNKIQDQQYTALILEFYLSGLNAFLDE